MLDELVFKVFHGPNLCVPFAAVAVELNSPHAAGVNRVKAKAAWAQFGLGPLLWPHAQDERLSFLEFAGAIACSLQHPSDAEAVRIHIHPKTAQKPDAIYLAYWDAAATVLVLRTAIFVADHVFRVVAGECSFHAGVSVRWRQVKSALAFALPQNPIIRTILRQARRRSIPVYPLAENAQIWMLGQGAKGRHFFEAANDRNSFTGMHLQRDKTWSNHLVKRLGFPGVTHALARDAVQAKALAHKIHYPVVVKPLASGKGNGISADVMNDAELEKAFKRASAFSAQAVIIEKFVQGDDHRLAVFGGKFVWAVARYPASVQAEGCKTIEALIQDQNQWRQDSAQAQEEGLIQLSLDEDMRQQLAKQGYTPQSCPPEGVRVQLRSVSNISKGGSMADVTDRVHPDNVAMAEAIARGFRMDTLGVDFITPDISRSWREVPCAVIEVNGVPGIFFDARIERVLNASFPNRSEGRILSVLVVDPPEGVLDAAGDTLAGAGFVVGKTHARSTVLEQHPRCASNAPLSQRVQALLLDPHCTALLVGMDQAQIAEQGLPVDKWHITVFFKPLAAELHSLLAACGHKVLDGSAENFDIQKLLNWMAVEVTEYSAS